MSLLNVILTDKGEIKVQILAKTGDPLIDYTESEWFELVEDSYDMIHKVSSMRDKLKSQGRIEDPFFMEA